MDVARASEPPLFLRAETTRQHTRAIMIANATIPPTMIPAIAASDRLTPFPLLELPADSGADGAGEVVLASCVVEGVMVPVKLMLKDGLCDAEDCWLAERNTLVVVVSVTEGVRLGIRELDAD